MGRKETPDLMDKLLSGETPKKRAHKRESIAKAKEKPQPQKTGRPIEREDRYTKRTINFSDGLWNELEVIALVKYGKSGSVTKLLHEAAEKYIETVKLPDDYEAIRKLILGRK